MARPLASRTALAAALALLLAPPRAAVADYVGSLVNRIFVDPQSIPVIVDGYQNGDVVSYILETTPADTGSDFGHAAWMTLYVPAGVEVLRTEFVLPATNGGYDRIPAEDTDVSADGCGNRGCRNYAGLDPRLANGFLNRMQQDTGIFYSTSSRTRVIPGSTLLVNPTGGLATGKPQTVYNRWDFDQTKAFGEAGAFSGNGGRGNTPVVSFNGGATWFGTGSIVAGPLTYYKNDYDPNCSAAAGFADDVACTGPWQRIAYENAKYGHDPAVPVAPTTLDPGPILFTAAPTCTNPNDVTTCAGWQLTAANPLPAATNAIRFVHGARRLGELENARVTLRITDAAAFTASFTPSSPTNDTFCLDSTGGDTSDPPRRAQDNPFRYYEPQHECGDSFLAATGSLFKVARFVNNQPSNGASLSANDIVSYEITFTNTSTGNLTLIDFSDRAESFDMTPTANLTLIEPGNPLCAWPSYDGNLPGPSYIAGSAASGTARWNQLASLAPGGQVSIFLCARVGGGASLKDRLDNTAQVQYNFSPSPADRVTLRSTTGGTVSTLISGSVYADADGSGNLTAGDAGIQGVTVSLYNDVDLNGLFDPLVDTFVDSVTTLTDGSYSFAGINAGSYLAVETDPVGWTSTGDKDSPGGTCGSGNGCNVIGTITVAAGGASTLNDFFDKAPGTGVNRIRGTVFKDVDQDMLLGPGEAGQGGVTVELYRDSNQNGMVDLGDILLQTQVSAADGTYEFTLSEAGSFVLQVRTSTLPAGSSLTTDNVETAVFVGFGSVDAGNDFGLFGGVGTEGGICYAAADGGDRLVRINTDGTGFVDIGGTGVPSVEALAYQPGTNRIYAADANRLGTLNPLTGAFTAVAGTFGTCTLPGGAGTLTVADVDGLAFDPFTGNLWGTLRAAGNDALLRINAATGTVVPNAFGPGVSCVRITGTGGDIDDIAIDPTDGTFYATASQSPDTLLTLDPATGVATPVGAGVGNTGIDDLEGLGFGSDGALFGSTGGGGTSGNDLVGVDTATGAASVIAAFPLYSDYEGLDCMTGGTNQIEGTVFVDVDGDGVYEPASGEIGQAGVAVRLYRDDGNGVFDAGDALIRTTTTDLAGEYSFVVAGIGDFWVDIDTATLPGGASLTTDNLEEASFPDLNNADRGNDFGFRSPSDLAVSKTSSAAGTKVMPGDVITYSVNVTNTSPTTQTGLHVFDPAPPGTAYVAESTSATGRVQPTTTVNLTAVADTYIKQDGGGDDNFGGDDELSIKTESGNSRRGLVRWDLSGIPAGSTIQSARMRFYVTRERVATVSLHRMTQGWVEGNNGAGSGATWLTYNGSTAWAVAGGGGDFAAASFGSFAPTVKDVYANAAGAGVVALVQDWVNGVSPNLGVILISNITAETKLGSRENSGKVPLLEITYLPPSVTKTNQSGDSNPLLAGTAPELVVPGDGFVLESGRSLTVTFRVRVDDPLDPSLTRILNQVTVSSNESFPAWDWASDPVSPGGAIGDRVWLDVDGDGVEDVGEPGLAGVTVELRDGVCAPGGGCPVTTTDANGNYLFDRLPPGTYTVFVDEGTLPGGLAASPGTVNPSGSRTITAEERFFDVDFGYTNADAGSAIIGDLVWSDPDGDGLRDPGEPGIAGVSVTLLDAVTGTPVGAPVTTAADGVYLLTGVSPGKYLVRVDSANFNPGGPLEGYNPTLGPQSPGTTLSVPITVAAGDVYLQADFGFANDCPPPLDFERDGDGDPIDAGQVFDDEWAAWGISISVIASGSGAPFNQAMAFDSANPTGGDVDLGAPNETCTPPGPGIGIDGEVGSPGENCLSHGNILIISEDGDASDPDDNGSGGLVFFDFAYDVSVDQVEFLDAENNDSVEVFDESGGSLFSSVTSAFGDNAYEAFAVGVTGARRLRVGFLASGAVASVGFCPAPPVGSIGDTVWLDANEDGIFDPTESAIPGVTVDLLDTAGNVVATTTSDAAGRFSFIGVANGGYTIRITDATGELIGLGGTTAPAQAGALAVTVAGDTARGINFGYFAAGTIGDTVWSDVDGDGIQGAGEPGIAGVTVELWQDADGNGVFDMALDTLVGTAPTDAMGRYLFVGLTPGTYFASVDDGQAALAGYTPTTTDEQVGAGAPGTQIDALLALVADSFFDADFGYRNAALPSVSGTVFYDADRDGVDDDPGEPGIAGVTIALVDASGAVVATTTTDAAGDYLFAAVSAGDYTVAVTDAAGVLIGYELTSGLDAIPITVAATDVTDVDFGYVRDSVVGSIGDTVWLDLDGDGVQQASEPGIPGVRVELWEDLDGDGLLSAGDRFFGLVARDEFESVSFANNDGPDLWEGDWIETDPEAGGAGPSAGAVQIVAGELRLDDNPDTGGEPSLAREIDLSGGYTSAFLSFDFRTTFGVDPSDEVVVEVSSDGGMAYTVLESFTGLSGAVAGSRTYDISAFLSADTRIRFRVSNLYGGGDEFFFVDDVEVRASPGIAVTDANGRYRFGDLPAGSYIVNVVDATVPAGLGLTTANDPTAAIPLSEGEFYDRADFGYGAAPGTGGIGDLVWYDADGDGNQDPGEVGIGGVTVDLYDETQTTLLATVMTAPDGRYLFTGLAPAKYVAIVDTTTLPGGFNTTPTNTPGGRVEHFPNVIAGLIEAWVDWGFDAPAGIAGSIGDRVFLDQDGDGVDDAGEPGIAGVTLDLLDSGGNVVATTTTDAAGAYDFVGLPAGDYTVRVTDIGGLLDDLNSSFGTNPTATISLAAGQDYNDADFGYAPADPPMAIGAIGNLVWHDLDNDGFRDAGESGISGVPVDLWLDVDSDGMITPGTDNLLRTATTDGSGEYEFLGLPAGDYVVDVRDSAPALAGFVRSLLGTPGTDDNGQPDPYAVTLTVAMPSVFWADFGYRADPAGNVSALSGTTYFDVAGDAIINADDRGIPGVTLKLYRDLDGNGVLDPGEPLIATTTSGIPDPMDPTNEGYYEFTDLPDGDYLVVSDPTGTFLFGKRQTTQTASAGVEPATIAGADSPNNDFGYTVNATLALVSRFEAHLEGGRVAIEWETASEVGTLGFYLYRWDREADGFVQVNAEILPAAVGSPAGGVYRFLDDGADPGAAERYALVEVESGGRETTYGPFVVRAAAGDWRPAAAGSEKVFRAAARRPTERARVRLQESRSEAVRGPGVEPRSPAGGGSGPITTSRSDRRSGSPIGGVGPRGPARGRVTAAKILVRETGVHRVRIEDVAEALDMPLQKVRRFVNAGWLALESRGEPVAWSAGDDGSSLVFFGRAADGIYARDNVYRLAIGRGTLMGTAAAGAPSPDTAAASFEHTEHHEVESFAATVATRDPESDYWFWAFVTAGNPTHGSKRFSLDVPDPAAGEGRLEVTLFGATATPIELEHHAVVRVNGLEVGETFWDGTGAHSFEVGLPTGTLVAGANEVEVEGRLDSGAPYSIFYVDSFDLSYGRYYRAVADRLTFRGDGHPVVTIGGFSGPEIEVYEIGEPASPKRVTGATIDLAGDGSFRVSLVPEAPDVPYVAVAGGSVLAPVAVVPDRPSFLAAETAGADYLVIAGSTLVEGAGDLASLRRRRGLRTLVVDVEDIYDEFNHGIVDPHAIRRFLTDAWSRWARRPRFVALAGGGTLDYKDHLGHGGNLVPPLMTATPFGLFAADTLFADVEGDDGVPEIAIGRVPAVTAGELGAYLEKLERYETATGGTRRVLLAADDADPAGNFPADSEALAGLLPEGVEAPRVYLGERPLAEARDLLVDWLGAGVDYLNFVGHGGIDRFAGEGLLTSADVPGLPANRPTPIVLSLTCAAGRFELPGFFALGSALVLEPDRGAVAVWSPSGLSFNDEAAILDRAFFAAAYGGEEGALGEAVNAALADYAERGLFPFMGRIYNVLGDPAVGLR